MVNVAAPMNLPFSRVTRSFLTLTCVSLATGCGSDDGEGASRVHDASIPSDASLPDAVDGSNASHAETGDGASNDAGSDGLKADGGDSDSIELVLHDAGGAGDGDGGDLEVNQGEFSIEAFEIELDNPGWHPLGVSRLGLIPREEVAFLVGSSSNWIRDDQASESARVTFAHPTPPGSTPIWALAGNFDDDGHAELAALHYRNEQGAQNIRLTISDNAGPEVADVLSVIAHIDIPHAGVAMGAIDAAIGDFDGDGWDEVAVASSGEGTDNWIRVFDYVKGELVLLADADATVLDLRLDAKLAAGNFDDDAADELAVLAFGPELNAVTLVIRDDLDADLAVIGQVSTASLLPPSGNEAEAAAWLSGGFLRAGNVDADEQSELFVLLTQHGSDAGGLTVMSSVIDDVTGTAKDIGGPNLSSAKFHTPGTLDHPFEAVFADTNGDGIDELYIAQLGSREEFFDWVLTRWVGPDDDSFNDEVNRVRLGEQYNPSSIARMTVVDGDELLGDGLLFAVSEGGVSRALLTVDIHAQPIIDADDVAHGYELADFVAQDSAEEVGAGTVPVVAGGDFDNDSLQVRYTGERWLSLPAPRPLVVLAAPPIKDGISQNVDSSETVFGTETTRETSATEEVGTTYGVGLSFETATLTGMLGTFGAAASVSFQRSLESHFASSETRTQVTTRGLSYGTSHPDDTVVFQGVLYTSYAYEIISATDPSVIGDRMTIDVPTAVKTFKWTIPYYNQNLPSGVPAIGQETLRHTPGDPSTYPTPQQRDRLSEQFGGWQSQQVTVGQGGNVSAAIISVGTQTTNTSTSSISDSQGWGVAIAGAGYQESRTVGETKLFEVTFGSATTYQGVVGDIRERAEYEDYAYDFGVFVYNFEHPSNLRYQVVNYWTANLAPGYR